MAKYQIFGNDGKKYEIEADSMDSAMDILDQHTVGSNSKKLEVNSPLYTQPDRLEAALPESIQPIYKHLKDPGWTNTMMKGVPIAGNFAENSPASKNIEENYPKTATGLKIAGGTAAMLAPAGAVSKGAATIAPGRTLETLAQGGLNVGVGAADRATAGKSQTARDAVVDFLGGAAGPAIGKFISPSPDMKRYTVESLAKMSEPQLHSLFTPSIREANRVAAKGAVGQGFDAITQNPLLTMLGGAATGHFTGGNPLMGAAIGAAATGGAHANVWRQHNTLTHSELVQAVLNSLGSSKDIKDPIKDIAAKIGY